MGGQPGTQFNLEVLRLDEYSARLPEIVEISAYRIVTEALTNASRHAQADNCTVMLCLEETKGGDRLRLEIFDDGIGISDHVANGVGVSSMKQRAEEIGGVFRLQSSPNDGTNVIAELPIAR
jgi:signal transduction histidine kinase